MCQNGLRLISTKQLSLPSHPPVMTDNYSSLRRQLTTPQTRQGKCFLKGAFASHAMYTKHKAYMMAVQAACCKSLQTTIQFLDIVDRATTVEVHSPIKV